MNIRKGDQVKVMAGKDRGKTGTVQHVFRSRGKVLVEGLNMVKKAVRPNPMMGQRGGIVVIVAHRESALMACDRIAFITGGQIVAEGTNEEVAARFGVATLEDAYLALVGRKELSRSHVEVDVDIEEVAT